MSGNPARKISRKRMVALRRDRDRLTPEERTQTTTTSRSMRRRWQADMRRKAGA